jgi:pantetheine-phosphate adenylyltransferase
MSQKTKKNKKSRALYPGTFDPVTNGHISLIERACRLFEEVIVAVAENAGKNPLFIAEERFDLMQASLADLAEKDQVKVVTFDGLLADLVIQHNAVAIVRGLRAVSDFEYEFQMALMNRKLARDAETVFLMPALSWVYLSSSIVKDVASHGGEVEGLVPPPVLEALKNKYGKA